MQYECQLISLRLAVCTKQPYNCPLRMPTAHYPPLLLLPLPFASMASLISFTGALP